MIYMKPTQILYGHRKFFEMAIENETQLKNGQYVPSRPIGTRTFFDRIYAAWLVFSGQADALRWLEDYYD